MADCTVFSSKPTLTINGTSTITHFLTTSNSPSFGNTLDPNIVMQIDGITISNTDPIVATTSYVSTFLSDNGLKIIDGNSVNGDKTIQIIYPGDIVIAQTIELTGVNLIIMSVYGSITINTGVTLSTSGTIAGTPASISLVAISSMISNQGTIDTSASSGFINLFANNAINNFTLNAGTGTIVISNNFVNNGTITANKFLNNPECTNTPLRIESIDNTPCSTVSGSTYSFNTSWCVEYLNGTTNNFSVSGTSLIITNNGPIEIIGVIQMPSNWSLQIITPCDLICTTDGTTTGTPLDIESGLDANALSMNFIVGGTLIAGSLAAQDTGNLFFTVGHNVVAIANSNYPGSANAGIGGANNVSPNSIVLISGADISIIGGVSSTYGNGAGIGGGGGDNTHAAGGSNIVTVTAAGFINAVAPTAPRDGGAAGIGGGGASGSNHSGGNANSPITLTAGTNITAFGGITGNVSAGAGAGIGGGGGGGTVTTGAGGGDLTAVVTLTALGEILVRGGSADAAGAGIGGGGGTTAGGGVVDPSDIPVYAAAPFFPAIIPGTGSQTSFQGQEAVEKLFTFTSFSCPVIIADQTFIVYNNASLGSAVSPNITVSPSNSTITITQQVDPSGNVINSAFSFSIKGTTIFIQNAHLSLGHYLLFVDASFTRRLTSSAVLTIDVQNPPAKTSLTAVWIVFSILVAAALAIAIVALVKVLQKPSLPPPSTKTQSKSRLID